MNTIDEYLEPTGTLHLIQGYSLKVPITSSEALFYEIVEGLCKIRGSRLHPQNPQEYHFDFTHYNNLGVVIKRTEFPDDKERGIMGSAEITITGCYVGPCPGLRVREIEEIAKRFNFSDV